MEEYSATLGLQPEKSVGFSERRLLETCKGINRTLATGTLSRDVCPHGPKIDSGYFLVPCTPGGCALFWEWNFIPKKARPQEICPG